MTGDGSAGLLKLYYRIGEVARVVGVEPHVLRYWEREFRSVRPQKSKTGQRVYSRKDVERLLRIKDLLHHQRYTIAGARRQLVAAGDEPRPADDPLGAALERAGHALEEARVGLRDALAQLGTPAVAVAPRLDGVAGAQAPAQRPLGGAAGPGSGAGGTAPAGRSSGAEVLAPRRETAPRATRAGEPVGPTR